MGSSSSQTSGSLSDKRLAIIGVGNMGGAIARGLVSANAIAPPNIVLCDSDPAKSAVLKSHLGNAGISNSALEAARMADVVLLAVKGAILPQILTEISPALPGSKLIVSIIAGKSLSMIEGSLPEGTRVVRAMPNTPAMVQAGATGIARGNNATDDDIAVANEIFGAVGKVVEVSEPLLDAVTGLSGSGPAYVFLVIEALTDGGVLQGLPRDTARLLAAQTVYGAAKMMVESGEHAAKLKDMVTTPGGTTIHGLAALEANGVRSAFIEAVAEATSRSKSM